MTGNPTFKLRVSLCCLCALCGWFFAALVSDNTYGDNSNKGEEAVRLFGDRFVILSAAKDLKATLPPAIPIAIGIG